jgi:ubiquinone/menaquinone biosynthesis C-methylase UbiE
MTANNDSKSLSQQRYARFAQRYVTSQAHAQGNDLDRLLAIAQPQPDWLVLDVATGGGHTALKFAPHVARVMATDITPKMLEAAEAHIAAQGTENVTYKRADAEDLPFADARFDLVTCRIAPHHFPDAPRFVREGARVLVPGGLLLVQDHMLPDNGEAARYIDAFERLRDPSHNRAYDEGEWTAMYRDAGLEVVHTEQVLKRHDFHPWAERQNCTPEAIARLTQMMVDAPAAVVEWIQPTATGTPEAAFANHHLLIAGIKGA